MLQEADYELNIAIVNQNGSHIYENEILVDTNNGKLILEVELKQLAMATNRACECEPSHINCLTAKDWIKCQLGVWQFYYEGRDIRDKTKHPVWYC